jgi:hypothetical protein
MLEALCMRTEVKEGKAQYSCSESKAVLVKVSLGHELLVTAVLVLALLLVK